MEVYLHSKIQFQISATFATVFLFGRASRSGSAPFQNKARCQPYCLLSHSYPNQLHIAFRNASEEKKHGCEGS